MRRASTTRPGFLLAVGLLLALCPGPAGAASSLRFFGNGTGDIDRVEIRIDGPARPADVGAGDFTLEWWMKAISGENASSAVTCGANGGWITGNVVFDRDVNGPGDSGDFGAALTAGRVAFGVSVGVNGTTICGGRIVTDGQWHHVAVTRRAADGRLRLYVDGMLDADGAGPTGNASYQDGRTTGDPDTDPFLVIGAQKRNVGPAYRGWIDEVRLSNVVRYTSQFTRPATPFTPDAQTVALYHLDEGTGTMASDTSGAAGGPSHGELRVGGAPAAGPVWSSEVAPLGGAATVVLEPVVTGLTSPVGMVHAGDARLFVVQQTGQIVIVDGTQIRSPAFLNIAGLIGSGGERGLLGLAFHPEYATNGSFFVLYTEPDGSVVIARYQRSAGDPNLANPASGQVLLRIPHGMFANHNGGQLAFGPDGYLYAAIGDGGGGGDPLMSGQSLGTLLGKLLRIDVGSAGPYAIPADNPFAGMAGAREIWAYGLRNPWRFGFDRLTGDLFIGDVGQGAREEIDFQPATSPGGENYGWSCMEGSAVFNAARCGAGPRVPPILEYAHGAGDCSVTGGFRYRGQQHPGLFGVYLFADFCAGRIWGGYQSGSGAWSSALLLDSSLLLSSFGEDQEGELYLTDLNGGLYRVVGLIPIQVTALAANLPSPQPVGAPITWTATVTGGSGSYQYRFWRRTTGPYMIAQDYTSSASFTWTPGPADAGAHEVAVWVRNVGSGALVEAGAIAPPFTVTPGATPIQVMALTANRTSPQPVGTAITWTATVTGGSGSYQYQYTRRQTPSASFVVVQPYGTGASYTWTPGPADVGTYEVAIQVRNTGSTAPFEASGVAAPFTITANAPLQVTAVTANRTSPQPVGPAITWTATVTGGSGSYQYRFWRRTTGAYAIVQDYGPSATFTWTPGPGDVGTHQVAVWVRNAGSSAQVEAGGVATPFTVTVGAPIQVTALMANRASPQPVGTPITWTATVIGGSGSYQYRFWRRTTGAYTIVQDYGPSTTFTWTPGPGDVGTHQVAVWVRNAGSSAQVEAGGVATPFTIGPP